MDINQALIAGKIVKIDFSKCEYGLVFGDVCEVQQVIETVKNKEILRCTIDNVGIYLNGKQIEKFVSLEEYEKIKGALDHVFYVYNDEQIKSLIKRYKRGVKIRGKVDCLNVLKPETIETLYKERSNKERVKKAVLDLNAKNEISTVTKEELTEIFEKIDVLTKAASFRFQIDIALDQKDKDAFMFLTKKLRELELAYGK